jgi:hypothetical protein
VEFIPERQGWFNTGKSITEICHTDRKTKPHIISTEKEFNSLVMKTLCLHLIKAHCETPKASCAGQS